MDSQRPLLKNERVTVLQGQWYGTLIAELHIGVVGRETVILGRHSQIHHLANARIQEFHELFAAAILFNVTNINCSTDFFDLRRFGCARQRRILGQAESSQHWVDRCYHLCAVAHVLLHICNIWWKLALARQRQSRLQGRLLIRNRVRIGGKTDEGPVEEDNVGEMLADLATAFIVKFYVRKPRLTLDSGVRGVHPALVDAANI